ncbi:MAG TPA: [LysW]-lysine hydrolase [Anaerolineae bacterium]|nr:[LysW]-lysine hydrolase [Anaerolineae bacterium]
MDEVAFLRELLEIYSPSGREGELAACLKGHMEALGFRVRVDEVGNVIGVLGPSSGEEVLLLGHMDTVEGFIPVRLQDGRLYGRGAVDAKGSLAAFVLAAARAALALRDRRLIVIGAVEEEAHGRGARHLVPRFRPRYAVVGEPSGWEGIALGYKGRLVVRYRLSWPVRHTATPEPSAAEEALRFWDRLSRYARRVNRGRERSFERLGVSLRSINTSGDGFEERVEMVIVLRTPPGMDVEGLRERVSRWADGAELRFAGGEAAFKAGKNNPLVRAFLRAIRAQGGRPRFKLKTGTSDMNVVGPAWGCPIVAYGPGDSALDHTPNEYIEIEEYLRAIEVLAQVLGEL